MNRIEEELINRLSFDEFMDLQMWIIEKIEMRVHADN